MSATSLGILSWESDRDDQGYRTYTVLQRVKTDSPNEGPATVMSAAGLFAVGSSWSFPDDNDAYVWCMPYMKCTQEHAEGEISDLWKVEQKFTNAPLSELSNIDNPLARAPVTSGSFTKLTKQIDIDRFGQPVCSTSFEPYKFEVDDNRPTVQISMTFGSLPLTTYGSMVDTVNDSTLWGVPARCVKLSNVSWSRHAYSGDQFYYEVQFEFEINFLTFDFYTFNHGSKKLKPGGSLTNPTHYEVAKDVQGENAGPFYIDALGQPITNVSELVLQTFYYYPQSNFLLLGIPAFL